MLSIAIRLKAEMFMEQRLLSKGNMSLACRNNQTRTWFDLGKGSAYQKDEERVLESVNIITPENIHLNAFMYEPLIDVSMYRMKKVYQNVCLLKA